MSWSGNSLIALLALFGPGSHSPLQDAPPAIPPPVEQLTANCARPTFATDQLVCNDANLRDLDRQLASALSQNPLASSPWLESQAQWFLRRSKCAFNADHVSCARLAYQERLMVLRPLDPRAKPAIASCTDSAIAQIVHEKDRLVLMDRMARISGVGLYGQGAKDWKPFLTSTGRKSTVVLRTIAGDSLRCRYT